MEITDRDIPKYGLFLWEGDGQGSQELDSMLPEPPASQERPTARQASASINQSPAASSAVVERKGLSSYLKSRFWDAVSRFWSSSSDVREAVVTQEPTPQMVATVQAAATAAASTAAAGSATVEALRSDQGRCVKARTDASSSQTFG